ncbi:MAG: DUF4349 domain-containing protein [Lachnospiraceae bacterium]|nr:DUF4349 domain-containing protein [Lachnospiraceae bacterium]
MKKKISALLLIFMLAVSTAACGGSSDMAMGGSNKAEAMDSYYYDYGVEEEVWAESGGTMDSGVATGGSSGTNEVITGDKLVYTCDLTIQTLDYDNCVQTIKDNIKKYSGIIESESEYDDAYRWYYTDYVKQSGTRSMNIIIRIPSAKYYEFLDTLEGNGKIISKNSYVENISRQYYETGAMIDSLEIQQERLLEMMEQTGSIEDMITIEARLSEVQYQLSLYKNQLASMDADVEYSTITISVEEVMEYIQDEPVKKDNTFLDRLQNTLVETWDFFWEMLEEILFLFIRLIPALIVIAVVLLIVNLIIRSVKKRKLRKLQKEAEIAHKQYAERHSGENNP